MSGQTSITDYASQQRSARATHRKHPWGRDTSPDDSRACRNCGSHVTSKFRRVFGDENAVAHHCIECTSKAMVSDGAARDPDYEVSGYSEHQSITTGGTGSGRI